MSGSCIQGSLNITIYACFHKMGKRYVQNNLVGKDCHVLVDERWKGQYFLEQPSSVPLLKGFDALIKYLRVWHVQNPLYVLFCVLKIILCWLHFYFFFFQRRMGGGMCWLSYSQQQQLLDLRTWIERSTVNRSALNVVFGPEVAFLVRHYYISRYVKSLLARTLPHWHLLRAQQLSTHITGDIHTNLCG